MKDRKRNIKSVVENIFKNEIIKNEQGVALVLVALMMVVLIGLSALVVDAGMLFKTKRDLVKAVDAAALAGASQLGYEIAVNGKSESDAKVLADLSAKLYAKNNGLFIPDVYNADTTEVIVPINIDTVSINGDNVLRVTVNVKRKVDFTFAKAIGFSEKVVYAHASAIVGAPTSVTGSTPFTINAGTLPKAGEVLSIKYGSQQSLGTGEYGALDFGRKGVGGVDDALKEQALYGWSGELSLSTPLGAVLGTPNDTWIPGAAGNKVGIFRSAIAEGSSQGIETDSRINRDKCPIGSSWNNYVSGCSRVVIVPVCDLTFFTSPDKKAKVVDFAAFYIDEYVLTGKDKDTIKGHYITALAVGEVGGGLHEGGTVYSVNLYE